MDKSKLYLALATILDRLSCYFHYTKYKFHGVMSVVRTQTCFQPITNAWQLSLPTAGQSIQTRRVFPRSPISNRLPLQTTQGRFTSVLSHVHIIDRSDG